MDDNLKTLALTLYGEARGEPVEGIIAVGSVIRNRVKATLRSYADICLAPKQFSSWNKDDPNYDILISLSSKLDNTSDSILRQCLYIASGIIGAELLDNTKGCRHYVTIKRYQELKVTQPNHWAMKMKVASYIGSQVFLYEDAKAITQ